MGKKLTIKERTKLVKYVATLVDKVKKSPVKEEYWEYDIGNWKIGINGYAKTHEVHPRNCVPLNIPPYSMSFWCNGMYMGWANPLNAIIVEGKNKKKTFTVRHLEQIIKEEIAKV